MTATTHALIGGVIASSIPDPALGITLSALSHPIVDIIPHWDFGCGWKKKSKALFFFQSSSDLILGVVLTFLLFGNTTDHLYLLASIFISESWDILQIPYLLLDWKFFPFSTFYHFGHQTNTQTRLPWGIFTQVATLMGLVLVLRILY